LSGSFLSKILNWSIRGIWLLFQGLLITWAALAIYYYAVATRRAPVASVGICSRGCPREAQGENQNLSRLQRGWRHWKGYGR